MMIPCRAAWAAKAGSVAMARSMSCSSSLSPRFAPPFASVLSAASMCSPVEVVARRLTSSSSTASSTTDVETAAGTSASAVKKQSQARMEPWHRAICTRHDKVRSKTSMQYDKASGTYACVDGPTKCQVTGVFVFCARHKKRRAMEVMELDEATGKWRCPDGTGRCLVPTSESKELKRGMKVWCSRHGKLRNTSVMIHDPSRNKWSCPDGPEECPMSDKPKNSFSANRTDTNDEAGAGTENPPASLQRETPHTAGAVPLTDEEICNRAFLKSK